MPVVATVRHTGTQFLANLLQQHFRRHYLRESVRDGKPPFWIAHAEDENMSLLKDKIATDGPLISPMRHPMEVARSWVRRKKPMGDTFKFMWRNLFRLHDWYGGLWLPLDTDDRESRLALIERTLGVRFETDWSPRGHWEENHEWRDGMTYQEVRDFYRQFDFDQFGYSL